MERVLAESDISAICMGIFKLLQILVLFILFCVNIVPPYVTMEYTHTEIFHIQLFLMNLPSSTSVGTFRIEWADTF